MPINLVYSVPQSTEGACGRSALSSASGARNIDASNAPTYGGRKHNAHTLDQKNHCRRRTFRTATLPYTSTCSETLQGNFMYFIHASEGMVSLWFQLHLNSFPFIIKRGLKLSLGLQLILSLAWQIKVTESVLN
jgi:hypothetical protein